MKYTNLVALIGTLIICSNAARAEDHPCANVKAACEAAGKKDKELRECVRTIREGGKVAGVNAEATPECKNRERRPDGPCAPVFEACKAAGKQGRDAWECVKTIKEGGTVQGVTVKASDECKAEKRGGGRRGSRD